MVQGSKIRFWYWYGRKSKTVVSGRRWKLKISVKFSRYLRTFFYWSQGSLNSFRVGNSLHLICNICVVGTWERELLKMFTKFSIEIISKVKGFSEIVFSYISLAVFWEFWHFKVRGGGPVLNSLADTIWISFHRFSRVVISILIKLDLRIEVPSKRRGWIENIWKIQYECHLVGL